MVWLLEVRVLGRRDWWFRRTRGDPKSEEDELQIEAGLDGQNPMLLGAAGNACILYKTSVRIANELLGTKKSHRKHRWRKTVTQVHGHGPRPHPLRYVTIRGDCRGDDLIVRGVPTMIEQIVDATTSDAKPCHARRLTAEQSIGFGLRLRRAVREGQCRKGGEAVERESSAGGFEWCDG